MKQEQVNKSLPLQYPLMGWNGFPAINASRSAEGVDSQYWLVSMNCDICFGLVQIVCM
jgi:hypothetical protein